MFSYLHSIRPNSRRSAVPPPSRRSQTTSSRYHHEYSTSLSSHFDPPPPQTSQSLSFDQSSISPEPPTLPPIPRVASNRESRNEDSRETEGQQKASTWPDTRAEPQEDSPRLPQEKTPAIDPGPLPSGNHPPPITPPDCSRRVNQDTDIPDSFLFSERSKPTPSRRKRPIDLAYESMRSYSEPTQRESFGTYLDNSQSTPQPLRQPPPPPPKPSQFQSPPQRQAPPPPVNLTHQIPPITSQKGYGKHKLNLLNPMSLLARRRSSQAVEEAYFQNQIGPGLRLPDDYDPRIRGKVVHDFSAPRPARPLSSNEPNTSGLQTKTIDTQTSHQTMYDGLSADANPSSNVDTSSSSPEKEHTPVFHENFDESIESWANEMENPAKERASAFMYQVSLQASKPHPAPASLPAFARNLPTNISTNNDVFCKSPTPPPKAPLAILLETPSQHQTSAKSSPPVSPPTVRSRATSMTDPLANPLGSPRRYTSNSSRFSFDLAGVGSAAQEKLLEEKHRQKAKRKERESVTSQDTGTDDHDGYADYDDMIDDDGLEERVPGVNADAEEFDMPATQQGMDGFSFISPNKSSFESAVSQMSTGLTSPATPRDSQRQSAGFAVSDLSPELSRLHHQGAPSSTKEYNPRPKSTPSPTADPSFHARLLQREIVSESNLAGLPRSYGNQDDDLYFDDGVIEDINHGEPHQFDESIFDDDANGIHGLPMRDSERLQGPLGSTNPNGSQLLGIKLGADTMNKHDGEDVAMSSNDSAADDAAVAEMRDSVADLNQPARTTSFSHPAGLTQDNLGLHDRLAFAANQAALEGKFSRRYSQSSTHDSHDSFDQSLGVARSDNPLNQQKSRLSFGGAGNGLEDFGFDDAHIGFDDAEDDDAIIAAANAEALENDDDGVYGQEFGFYARASGSSKAEYANGGYFGPRALEGIHRMNSGRDNFQEPSLTPITERSEWSNRNSTISLAMHGYPLSAQFPSNPHLADLMHLQEGAEMSFEALGKLRHKAWGGSSASQNSSSNSQNSGSPLTHLPPWMMATPILQQNNNSSNVINPGSQNMVGSFYSPTSSNDSDHSPVAGSPTMTLSSSQSGLTVTQTGPLPKPMGTPPQPMGPPPPPPTDSSPTRRNAMSKPWAPGHSRNSSGAESVSYREEGGQWFLERTRMIEETGEVEMLERSLVEGGRI